MTTVLWFSEGFDHTDPATAPLVYDTLQGTYSHTPGPYHGNAARFAGGGNGLPGESGGSLGHTTTLAKRIGFAAHVRLNGSGAGGGAPAPVRLYEAIYDGTLDVPPSAAFAQNALEVDPDGALRFVVGASTVAESAAGALPWGDWHHLELQVCTGEDESQPAERYVRVRVDGADVLHATDLETAASPPWITCLRFGNLVADGNTVAVDVDDVLVSSWPFHEQPPTRSEGPAWQGPKRIYTRFPAGPTGQEELVAVGATNWAANAEAPPDLDTTRVYCLDAPVVGGAATTRQIDRYVCAPGPFFVVPPPRVPPPEGEPVPPDDPAAPVLSLWFLAHGPGSGADNTLGRGIAYLFAPGAGGDAPPDPDADEAVGGSAAYHRATAWRYHGGGGFRIDADTAEALGVDPDDPGSMRAMARSLQLGWEAGFHAEEGNLVATQCCAEFCYLAVAGGRGTTWALWWP